MWYTTTPVGAFDAVTDGGKAVLVALGKTTLGFESFDFITRATILQGSTPVGKPEHLKAVLELMDSGQLEIASSDVGFDGIPEGLNRLAEGGSPGVWWRVTTSDDSLVH